MVFLGNKYMWRTSSLEVVSTSVVFFQLSLITSSSPHAPDRDNWKLARHTWLLPSSHTIHQLICLISSFEIYPKSHHLSHLRCVWDPEMRVSESRSSHARCCCAHHLPNPRELKNGHQDAALTRPRVHDPACQQKTSQSRTGNSLHLTSASQSVSSCEPPYFSFGMYRNQLPLVRSCVSS